MAPPNLNEAPFSKTKLTSSCHCKAVQITFPKPDKPVIECQCSTCRRTGAMWAGFPKDQVEIRLNPSSTHEEGKLGTGGRAITAEETADVEGIDHYGWKREELNYCRCSTCGNVTHWVATEAGQKEYGDIIEINCRLLEPEDLAKVNLMQHEGPP